MGGSQSTLWWIIAGALVAAELLTGTFYLLMLAVGALAGALAALAGFTPVTQVACAAVAGGLGAAALWQWRRTRQRRAPAVGTDPSLNLDIGQAVQVDAWQPDGTARVLYRGSMWNARQSDHRPLTPGLYRIRGMAANELLLEPADP